ncbi:MAG: ABC transporter permease subunit [Veillonella sp.]
MGKYFDVSYMIQAFPQLLNYVHVTVLITVISAILGVILGSIIAIIRLKKVPVLNQLFIVFISFMRGTPFLVQLFLIYFGVPEIMSWMGLNMKMPGLVFVYAVFLHMRRIVPKSCAQYDAAVPGERRKPLKPGMTEFPVMWHHLAAGFHHEHSTVDEPRYRHVERASSLTSALSI